jgi:hypothetical protein
LGFLYTTVTSISELKRNNIIERLLAKGIKETKDGVSIYDLDYRALKFELAIADFREIAVEKDANKWF